MCLAYVLLIMRGCIDAVKRWFHDDWQRIEPKLRTSIVGGISVFLSLFDDNPKVKRVLCPPKECYDREANADVSQLPAHFVGVTRSSIS
jgi:hypothetical protein